MEDNKDINVFLPRTEFSDFVINSSRRYFDELILPEQQKERMMNMLVIPFGSVVLGNASELSSDLDLIFVEDNPATYKKGIMPFTDGYYNRNKISLGKYIFDEYEKTHLGIKERRKGCVHPEYVKEVEVDNPHPLVDDLLEAIDNNTLKDEESGASGHSGAILLGLVLNANPSIVIAGSPELLGRIQAKIRNHLQNKPKEQKIISDEYNQFLQWKKLDSKF